MGYMGQNTKIISVYVVLSYGYLVSLVYMLSIIQSHNCIEGQINCFLTFRNVFFRKVLKHFMSPYTISAQNLGQLISLVISCIEGM